MVSMEEFAANPHLTLLRWGRVKGVLKRPSGPGRDENLDLSLAEPELTPVWHIDIGNHVVTDPEGRFEFERVPPGRTLNLFYRIKIDDRKWRSVALWSPFKVGAGETLKLPIEAPERKTPEAFFIPQLRPCAKSGSPITGVVTLGNGEPAAGAEVALVVPNQFLQLKRFALERPDQSLKTETDANGHFTLPGVPDAKAIVAVNKIGFAKIPLQPGMQAATLAMQPWGKIFGTLRIGQRLGANERIVLASAEISHDMRLCYSHDFQAMTDSSGRFIIAFVPPGEQRLCRAIPRGKSGWETGSWTQIMVRPGDATEVKIGGTGLKVVGKITVKPPQAVTDWNNVKVTLITSQYAPPKHLKTKEERDAWYDSDEGQEASRKMRHYKSDAASDGSFSLEDVEPEDYSLTMGRERITQTDQGMHHLTMMMGGKKVSVPGISGDASVAVCDIGTVEVSPPPEFPAAPK